MKPEPFLKVDGKVRYDVRVECSIRRGYCTGMITEKNGNELRLSSDSEKHIVFEDGKEYKVLVGSTKYYDTLVFVSEPM